MKIIRAMSLIMCIVVIVSIGGVYAVWKYATGGPAPKDVEIPLDMDTCAYAITYVNNSEILDVIFVEDNSAAVSTANEKAQELAMAGMDTNKVSFKGWMNAGSTIIDSIDAGNTEDITLYPAYNNLYTATFVDQDGNILAWDHFTDGNYSNIVTLGNNTVPPTVEDCTFDYWQVHVTKNGKTTTAKLSEYRFADAVDITVYPVYTFNGDVNLIPMDNDGDGITDEYHVGGYNNPNGQSLVEIPDYVNGIPITAINADAFSSYDGVHSVVIPKTIVTVGGNVLAEDWSGWFDSGETVTIYFEGSYDEWIAKEATFTSGWDNGISASSRIFFLNGTGKVDTTQGYLQASKSGNSITWSKADITDSLVTEYTDYCDCSISTTGDTAHVYVDASGNVMGRNAEGTPVNNNGTVIRFEAGGWFSDDKLTDGTNTYYRYRPDRVYWLN